MFKFINFFIPIIFLLFISSCGVSEDMTKELDVHEDAYFLEVSLSKRVETEFGRYYFKTSEVRDIMAKGWYPENEPFNSVYVAGVENISSQIGNGPNMYKQYTANPTGYKFVVPIEIRTGNVIEDISALVRASNVSSGFTIAVGLSRDYHVIYNAMIGYNLYDRGYDFDYRVQGAFNGAYTELYITTSNINLPYQEMPWGLDYINAVNSYFKSNGIIPQNPPPNNVYLTGCGKIHDPTNIYKNILGATIPSNTSNNYKIICIFIEHLMIPYPNNEDRTKKYITYASIHELGHARGKEFLSSHGYGNHDITDSDHMFGHNGTYKNYCVMRYRNMPADPNFTEDRFLDALDDPKFCYGHLQMLLNAEW